jgi:protease PrsW
MTNSGPWADASSGVPEPRPEYAQAPLPTRQAGAWTRATPPLESLRHRILNLLVVLLLAAVMVLTLVFFAASLGASVFFICGALALIPLLICLLTLYWLDRWEPEPRTALLFAFCWGAGVSVVAALVVGQWVQPFLLAGASLTDPETVGTVLQAPLVEETCKGAGVLLIFLLRRRIFDGPIDGVVYGGTVGAGFAFTENILYFGQAISDAQDLGGALVKTFIVRGLMSPFAHVMFTAALGAVMGLAARHGGPRLTIGAWFVGLVPAMCLHALWNSSSLISSDFFVVYTVLQMPLFVAYGLGVVLLRSAEARLTRRRLADYVGPGWLAPEEVPMLGTSRGRRRAVAWARTFGGTGTMKDFIHLATRLAFNRQKLLLRNSTPELARYEGQLLQQVSGTRAWLLEQQRYFAEHGRQLPNRPGRIPALRRYGRT